MIEIREMEMFSKWLAKLRDQGAKARIASRIRRLAFGNPGDVEPVGEGVSELRIHYGPGYRVYFIRRGGAVYVLLCGGSKASQKRDIKRAKEMARVKQSRSNRISQSLLDSLPSIPILI